MPEETIDPGLLEQTKNQIRQLVGEIAELAESDIQPPEFYVEFLNRSVAAVAASGGALWVLDGRGGLKLQYQLEFRLSGLMDGRIRTQPHDALLGCMVQAGTPQIIPPQATVEGLPNAGNPTNFTLIIAPLMVDKQVVGLLEILMDPTRKAANQKSTLRFVSDLCDLAGTYLKNRQMRQMVSQQKLWNQLETFSHDIHASLQLKDTSFTVANDGKRLVGCDRLSVTLKVGGRTMVEAVSGQEVVEQRANLIRDLTKLCKVVMRSGEDLVYTGNTEGFAPDIRDALETYVDESGSKVVVITLLYRPDTEAGKDKVAFGCIAAEQIGDEVAPTDIHARCEVVSRHASTALWNASEHDKTFLPILKAVGSPWRFFRGRTLAKIVAGLLAIVGIVCILAFVPWKLTIEGRGALLPEKRQTLYAPLPGIVSKVLIDHAQRVAAGELLAVLENKDLEKDLRRLIGEEASAKTQETQYHDQAQKAEKSRNGEYNSLKAQEAEARTRADSSRQQIEIIRKQLAMLEVKSPIAGMITSWEPQKNLTQRPVEIGQELLQVAATEGDWIMEVDVPDDDMGPVLEAKSRLEADIKSGAKPAGSTLRAYFVIATDSNHKYEGYVQRISSKAELVEQKHVVKVTVGFSEKVRDEFLANNKKGSNRPLRPGAEVRARIDCGEARLSYVIFRDVLHVFYETVMFRWPFLD
jgi:multidrug efflux pump subunit AcrA (membrane-fusion protein)